MAAETKLEQHLRLREHKPAIERSKPTINDVPAALDAASCFSERVGILLRNTLGEMHEVVTALPAAGGEIGRGDVSRLYDSWIILEVVGEKLAELDDIVAAICQRAHSEAREVAA